jgi:membrane fusion protein (multidrug efflux system)
MDGNRRDPPQRDTRDIGDWQSPSEDTRDLARDTRRRDLGFMIGGIVAVILVTGGVLYWLHARHYESTDDAFVDGNTTQMAPQVAGRVTALLFTMSGPTKNSC